MSHVLLFLCLVIFCWDLDIWKSSHLFHSSETGFMQGKTFTNQPNLKAHGPVRSLQGMHLAWDCHVCLSSSSPHINCFYMVSFPQESHSCPFSGDLNFLTVLLPVISCPQTSMGLQTSFRFNLLLHCACDPQPPDCLPHYATISSNVLSQARQTSPRQVRKLQASFILYLESWGRNTTGGFPTTEGYCTSTRVGQERRPNKSLKISDHFECGLFC